MTFHELELHPNILKALEENNYLNPTEIQARAIPQILEGEDLKASAQTGTGKTAAFLLPALHRLATTPRKHKCRGPRVLILSPTRELGMQIAVQADKYSRHMHKIKTVCINGGVPYHKQLRDLSRPYEILIATPGRLIDYLNQRKIDLSGVEMLVLDEADRMLDMGFIEPVEEIVSHTSDDRQTLLFSATLRGEVASLANKLLNDPQEIVVHAEKAQHENITQAMHFADDMGHKVRLLEHILENDDVKHMIIFTSTKRSADDLAIELREKGYRSAALHGDINQGKRTRTLAQMRSGKIKVLVATDVAARGIDVNTITHVVNFDLPRCSEDYVHRIGRTGRAGANGFAFSFVSGRDVGLLRKIEHYTGHKIDSVEFPGLAARAAKNIASDKKKKRFTGPRSGPSRNKRPFFKRGGASNGNKRRSNSGARSYN